MARLAFTVSRVSVEAGERRRNGTSPAALYFRAVAMTEGLAEVLFDLLGIRRRQAMASGWPEIPEWVFCSDAGTALDERNFSREWYRLRRRTEKHGICPLKLHATRHTWATLALQAGKSLRWVADQLGA